MATVSIADILKAAVENMDMVAEAEARLAAAGHVSLLTWEKQAKAVEYLSGRQRQEQQQEEKLSKNSKALADAFKGVQTSMVTTAATVTGTFFELRHLAGAAHPGYLKAFDGALGLLQARLAGSLLPVFDAAIDTVMDVADWFDTLSEGSKKLVAGGLVAVPLVIGLGSALRALSPVLMLASVATKKLTAAAQENAALGAVGRFAAVAGGVGTLGAAAFFLGHHAEPAENAAARPNEEEVKHAIELARVTGGGGMLNFEEFQRLSVEEQRKYARVQAERFRGFAERDERNFLNRHGYTRIEEGEAGRTAEILERLSNVTEEGIQTKEEDRARRQIQRQAMRVSAIQQVAQPRYSPLAEARKQLQLQNLGKNRYEIEILREQRKHRLEEIKRLDTLIDEFRRRFPNAQVWS